MEQTTSTFNFSCPRALLLAALFVVVIETSLGSIPREAWGTLFEYSDTRTDRALDFWAKLELSDPAVTTIYLLGSSQVREGVDSGLLGELLGAALGKKLQVVNLGGNKLGMPELYLQLDSLLPKKPAFLVVAPSPRSRYWSYEDGNYLTTASDYAYSLASSAVVCKEFGLSMDRGIMQDFGLRSVLYNTVPSTRYVRAFDVPKLIGRYIRDEPTTRTDYALGPNTARRSLRAQLRFFGQPKYSEETLVHERMTQRFAETVVASGTRMSFVEFPMHPNLLKRLPPSWQQALQQSGADVDRVATRYNLAHLSRNHLPSFDRREFFDGTHLNPAGRKKMTHILADHLIQQMGSESLVVQQ
jgi:hypothetical protein